MVFAEAHETLSTRVGWPCARGVAVCPQLIAARSPPAAALTAGAARSRSLSGSLSTAEGCTLPCGSVCRAPACGWRVHVGARRVLFVTLTAEPLAPDWQGLPNPRYLKVP